MSRKVTAGTHFLLLDCFLMEISLLKEFFLEGYTHSHIIIGRWRKRDTGQKLTRTKVLSCDDSWFIFKAAREDPSRSRVLRRNAATPIQRFLKSAHSPPPPLPTLTPDLLPTPHAAWLRPQHTPPLRTPPTRTTCAHPTLSPAFAFPKNAETSPLRPRFCVKHEEEWQHIEE